MKKTLLIAILLVAAGWLTGCSICYEEYAYHPYPSRIVVSPPPIEVVEVIHVPPHHRRHHRRPYHWR